MKAVQNNAGHFFVFDLEVDFQGHVKVKMFFNMRTPIFNSGIETFKIGYVIRSEVDPQRSKYAIT